MYYIEEVYFNMFHGNIYEGNEYLYSKSMTKKYIAIFDKIMYFLYDYKSNK